MRVLNRKGDFIPAKADPHLTQDKYEELLAKLEHLKKVTRLRLMKEVAKEAENGDFSENASYQIAKGKLRGVNEAILYLEEHLKKAVIIKTDSSKNSVEIGSRVTIKSDAEEKTYLILGSSEVDLKRNIISHNSPLGMALLGRRKGESIELKKQEKLQRYIITDIQ